MSGLGLVRSLQGREELDYNNREHQTNHDQGSEETLQAIGVARLYSILSSGISANTCIRVCSVTNVRVSPYYK